MLLSYSPYSARLIFLFSIVFGLGLPVLSAPALQLPSLSQLSMRGDLLQEDFEPPGEPVPFGTRGAGSRGIVFQPTFPKM